MSEFKSVKCDECGRIQDGVNHWLKMMLWVSGDGNTISMGPESERLLHHNVERQVLDLCGQGCAVKVIARLLKWNIAEAG